MKSVGLFIGGSEVDATSGQTFPNFNPATNEKICDVQQASKNDVDKAVTSAKNGLATWASMSGLERARILNKAADELRRRNSELAALETIDNGKPIAESLETDILSAADCIQYYAGVAQALHGHHYQLGSSFAYTIREPLGVCVGIGAWNYPIQIAAWKSAPALACGNAFIFKPSELTPLSAMKLAEIYTQAGVPNGVFNVIQGDRTVGQYLVEHPDVAKVSLTGDVSTGKKVMSACASTLKHVTLELGGKSPLIIFPDCNMDNAISATMMANFYTQGEICSNGTRVYVHKSIHDQFVEKLVSRVSKLVVGDPMSPTTTQGALISQSHLQKVLGYIELGKKEGAKCVFGGNPVSNLPGSFAKGNFVQPTVFIDCRDSMRIVKEEIFGPVVSILQFDDEDDVINRANDTHLGLAAGVFTNDLQVAHRVVKKLQAGICWINNYNITPVEVPFGGAKQSGFGRENSLITIEHYTQLKSVYVEMGNVVSRI